MAILVVGGVLVGIALGQFFKCFVLIPASGLAVILVLANPAHIEHSLLGSFLQFVVLTISLQFGYVVGLFAHNFQGAPKRSKDAAVRDLDEPLPSGIESREHGSGAA